MLEKNVTLAVAREIAADLGAKPATAMRLIKQRFFEVLEPGFKYNLTDIAAVLARIAPLVDVVRSAARANPEIAELYARLHRGRRDNLETFIAALDSQGMLREGLDRDSAVATVWRLASPELFLLVTRTEGIAQADYADWLAGMLEASLLDGAAPRA